jgi:chemotaxis protein methyltransferase CheR
MQLRPGEMALMRQMALQLAGISLDESKGYLVETRLGPIAERVGCTNFNELYFRTRYNADKVLLQDIVEAITTHETIFFRDGAPYEALQYKLLPEVIDARERMGQPRKLRIWSAACSTGQEPYSIGIVLHELLRDLKGWDIQIVATDIAKATLQTAERGIYAAHEIARSAKPALMQQYFEPADGGFRVRESVRKLVQWRQLNLLEPFQGLGTFDIVFLRNVLIYFEADARRDLARRAGDTLLPHGWLVVGAAENLLDAGPQFQPQTHCRATVYQPRLVPAGKA